jgi:hypothetical protein
MARSIGIEYIDSKSCSRVVVIQSPKPADDDLDSDPHVGLQCIPHTYFEKAVELTWASDEGLWFCGYVG